MFLSIEIQISLHSASFYGTVFPYYFLCDLLIIHRKNSRKFYVCFSLSSHLWFSTGCLVGSQANRLPSPQQKTWRTPLLSPIPTPPWTMWPRCWSPLTEGWQAWTARPAAPCLEEECTYRGWARWAASRWAKASKRKIMMETTGQSAYRFGKLAVEPYILVKEQHLFDKALAYTMWKIEKHVCLFSSF